MLHIHCHTSFRTQHPGQLDLRFGQVKPEPHLSIGQVKFKIFF